MLGLRAQNILEFHPEALARRSNQERLQNKIVITRKCLPEALARGSPQERLWNKIALTRKCLPEALARVSRRKGSRTTSPGSAFKRLWSEGPRREGVP